MSGGRAAVAFVGISSGLPDFDFGVEALQLGDEGFGGAEEDDGGAVGVQAGAGGVADGLEERIFQPFERADSPADAATSGTGLGLYISRSLVELHGGQIKLESRLGKGTCFTVTLPTQRPEGI